MTDAPFGPFSEDAPGPGSRQGPPRRPWQRAVRCPEAGRRRREVAPLDRFEGFVALHAAVSATPSINTARLWAGGVGTAVVAALMTLVGGLIARGVLGIAVPAPVGPAADGSLVTMAYALCAAALALQATALLHVLLAVAPRPLRFFASICGSLTLIAAIAPFATGAPAAAKVATAAINIACGIVIIALLASTAVAAQWLRPPGFDPAGF